MRNFLLLIPLLSISALSISQQEFIPFDSDQWSIQNGKVTEYLGEQCLMGTAQLNGIEFTNGIIEFDMAVSGQRSYPGIYFRMQSPLEYEHFYIRPHRVWYDDALQYTPAFNGSGCWQLYRGEGFNAGYEIPKDDWMHFKIEVKDDQTRVYIDDGDEPDLFITDLRHGISSGSISLNAFADGSAYFANFSLTETNDLDFPPKKKQLEPYGMISDWEVTQVFDLSTVDETLTTDQQDLGDLQWQTVQADQSGLVNLSKLYRRTHRMGDAVFAKTTIVADNDEVRKYNFGYSDVISIFINGQVEFTGLSPYRYRDQSFLGIIGLFDAVYLPLKKGNNELMLMVGEGFGGWGFMVQDADAIYVEEGITKTWETEAVFTVPESVVYDPKREVLYVTNFDQAARNTTGPEQYISKLSPEGEILEMKYIDSLDNPLGMQIYNDKLFVAEKGGFAIINLNTTKVEQRIDLPEAMFPNDLEIDKQGRVYISDSRKNVIWICENGTCEIWLEGKEILDPNTLRIIDNKLFVGNSGDQWLKAFDLDSKKMELIADMGPGFIDGIRVMQNGDLLVSVWQGYLFRVTKDGQVTKVLDLHNNGIYIADFEYVQETQMLYIPSFYLNKVVAFKVGQ